MTDRGEKVDQFYRRVFQDILDFDNRGNTIEGDIVRRIRDKANQLPWVNFLTKWSGQDDKTKIQHVLDRAASVVTRVVFGRWNQIFGEDVKGKEMNINLETFEGEVTENGVAKKTTQHDIGINFEIKDGTRRFAVNDRSLGFRWFFSFMLFTQFRVARAGSRPLLFLFDEPAANLHAAAQEKLIESFPEIAKGDHMLAYTTHSHYMIEPKWLEQTFIVTNRSDMPTNSVIDAVSFDDESLDIRAIKYRIFANENPSKTSYFQPILDRLRVSPSRFDFDKIGIVLEGKSDYYILRYATALHGKDEIPLLPGLGAGTFESLIALQIGWGLKLLFVLDGDRKGVEERQRYISELGLDPDRVCSIDDLAPKLNEIEDLVNAEASTIISDSLGLGGKPTKNQIRRFFQEHLASGKTKELGAHFKAESLSLLDSLAKRIEAHKVAPG